MKAACRVVIKSNNDHITTSVRYCYSSQDPGIHINMIYYITHKKMRRTLGEQFVKVTPYILAYKPTPKKQP